MVLANRHDEAIAEFYAPDATMQENLNPPRQGRDLLVAHERAVLARQQSVKTALGAPPMVNGDHVALQWIFDFIDLEGRATRIVEMAHQRWADDYVQTERFYYDPAQLKKAPRG